MSEETGKEESVNKEEEKQPPKKRVKKTEPLKKSSKKDESESSEVTDEGETKTKKGKTKGGKKKSNKLDHPKTIDMILEALENLEDKNGSSVQAIKAYIIDNYKQVLSGRYVLGAKKRDDIPPPKPRPSQLRQLNVLNSKKNVTKTKKKKKRKGFY
ncbi:hypothetical protein Anas_10540 [Armadillidium nasatum]|uniref:H15 domain-containing protein n=1 Tax=Armadillidium nasatum TaxID=96803 RepID=A0A5N5SMF4_9CRUS|nr:hypothetical protein Anas_10540 [Armadillidium nasatum]